MAKKRELTPIKKGKAEFILTGKAKLGDYTYKMNIESQKSDWIYNSLNLGVDCGQEYGLIYGEAMGGYGAERENILYVHGKKTDDNGKEIDDFKNGYTIAWEDRHDEEVLEEIGEMSFLTAKLEKLEDGKIATKKFLSEYDFIEYIQDHLEDGDTVVVKGLLEYSIYNDVVQMKRKIKSISLTKAEEKDFKAEFTQTLLVEDGAVGKVDKETYLIPVEAKVVDYVKEFNGKLAKRMLPLAKEFKVKVNKENADKMSKMLKHFKAKKNTVTKITVNGYFTKAAAPTVEVTEADIPEDIMELIEIGALDKEDVLGKIAFKNGAGKIPEIVIIKTPAMKFIEGDGQQIPTLDKEAEAYHVDDLDINLILEDAEELEDVEKEDQEIEESEDEKETEVDDDDDNWLIEFE